METTNGIGMWFNYEQVIKILLFVLAIVIGQIIRAFIDYRKQKELLQVVKDHIEAAKNMMGR